MSKGVYFFEIYIVTFASVGGERLTRKFCLPIRLSQVGLR